MLEVCDCGVVVIFPDHTHSLFFATSLGKVLSTG